MCSDGRGIVDTSAAAAVVARKMTTSDSITRASGEISSHDKGGRKSAESEKVEGE